MWCWYWPWLWYGPAMMETPLPEGHVVHMPARPGQPHKFGEPVFVEANAALDRHSQTERTCSVCGAVKVTVHAPDGGGWREWRVGATTAQIETNEAPPCEMRIDKEELLKP
jgi:hypothetical protein